MNENKMVEVARMFNKKVGEEFTILHQDEKYKACFTKQGIHVHGMSVEFWDGVLIGLLVGDHTWIVEQ